MLFSSQAQPRSFEILNPQVQPGDTVVVRIEPQWRDPLVCIAAFKKHYAPNPYGYVFIGIDMSAKPSKEQIFRIECGRGIRLDSYQDDIIIIEKEFPKTRTARRGGCGGIRKGSQAKAINYAFSLKNRSLPDLTDGISYDDPSDLSRDTIDFYGLIYLKTPKCSHSGVDLRMSVGTGVRAVNKGIVALAAKNFKAEGNMIILNHGLGTFSVYMHLLRINVRDGEVVDKGQIIGLSGRTGIGIREPHLHFGIKIHDNYVDPLNFIDTVNRYSK